MSAQLSHQVCFSLKHLPNLIIHHFTQHDLDGNLPSWHVLLVKKDVSEAPSPEHMKVREAG